MPATKRESNFELLRIVSMLIIILSHYSVHGNFDTSLIYSPFHKLLIRSTGLGEVGVQCFFLISGYFMAKASFHLKKLIQLELQLIFYSVSFGAFTYFVFPELIDFHALLRCFFPALTTQYWFMSVYILIYLSLPFVNFFMNHASRRLLEYTILLLAMVYIVLPTLTSYTLAGESNITLFLTVYMIGGYIRLYPDAILFFNNRTANLWCALFCYLILVASVIILRIYPVLPMDYFLAAKSLPLILLSISLFLAAKNTHMPYCRFINWVGSSVLGVYLIHDNEYIRTILWQKILRNASYGNSPFLLIHMIMSVLCVFIVCVCLDKLRIYFLEKPLMRFLAPHLDKLEKS